MTQRELLGTSSHKECISQTYAFVVLVSPFDVVLHRHEDNPSLELFWFTTQVFR